MERYYYYYVTTAIRKSLQERSGHRKVDFLLTQEKWAKMNFENVLPNVFEDVNQEGVKRSKKSKRKWVKEALDNGVQRREGGEME